MKLQIENETMRNDDKRNNCELLSIYYIFFIRTRIFTLHMIKTVCFFIHN